MWQMEHTVCYKTWHNNHGRFGSIFLVSFLMEVWEWGEFGGGGKMANGFGDLRVKAM